MFEEIRRDVSSRLFITSKFGCEKVYVYIYAFTHIWAFAVSSAIKLNVKIEDEYGAVRHLPQIARGAAPGAGGKRPRSTEAKADPIEEEKSEKAGDAKIEQLISEVAEKKPYAPLYVELES
jgi:hypothetical protein